LALIVFVAATALPMGVFAASALPVYGGCTSKVKVRPTSIVFTCADANFYAAGLRWTRWDSKQAVASGVAHANDCVPYCAAGHFHTYRVDVTLSSPVVCAHLNEFTKVSWRFPAAKPAHQPRRGSESFDCRFRKVRP
jgi:hypothetical protein